MSEKKSYKERAKELWDMLIDKHGGVVVGDRLKHPSGPDVETLPVVGYRQTQTFTCGFAAGLMVLHSFFPSKSIDSFWYRVKPTVNWGVSTRKLADALRQSGVRVAIRDSLVFSGIVESIERGRPVVTTVDCGDEYHWVVLYGIGRSPNRVFVAGTGIPWLGNDKQHAWGDFRKIWRPAGFGMVCWKKS